MNFPESMKYANKKRMICEVIREIFDIDHCREDKRVVEKLKELHSMAKRMSTALYLKDKEYDKGWWKENTDYEEDLKRRLNEDIGL